MGGRLEACLGVWRRGIKAQPAHASSALQRARCRSSPRLLTPANPPSHCRAGVPTPTVTIRYKNLSVRTSALIGDKDLPTLPHAVQHALFSFLEAKRPLSIVDDASGILRPGRLTLMLGPPSSGKTTFMKALVGRYRHSSDLKVHCVGGG